MKNELINYDIGILKEFYSLLKENDIECRVPYHYDFKEKESTLNVYKGYIEFNFRIKPYITGDQYEVERFLNVIDNKIIRRYIIFNIGTFKRLHLYCFTRLIISDLRGVRYQ